MIWGVTLRSPHPYARIRSIDIGPALATPGVYAVLTHEDVPGSKLYGLEIADQPVLAVDTVRYHGEPVALVAADHPEIARQAAKRIRVNYDVYEPITDAREALGHPRWNQVHNAPGKVSELSRERAVLHPQGNLVRHLKLRKGDPEPEADVVVIGEYEVGMQDQAFLGPESGLAVPAEDGGVELYVATQWLHVDQRQICAALGLPPEKVRLTLAGVGGAFGGREDLSMHIHACMLALHTRQAGEDGLQPGGVLLRARAPPPGGDALRARRQPRRHAGLRQGADLPRRRRLRLEHPGRRRQRGHDGDRAVRRAERAGRCVRRLHQQPAVRGDARVRLGAGRLRPRGPDGQAGRRARHGPRGAALPQRDDRGRRGADRAGDRQRRAGRGAAAAGAGDAAAAAAQRGRRGGPAGPAGRRREHHPR